MTLQDIALTAEEVNNLVDFLLTLTDPCVKSRECLSPWIPNETQPDPDGMRLVAVDERGQPFFLGRQLKMSLVDRKIDDTRFFFSVIGPFSLL